MFKMSKAKRKSFFSCRWEADNYLKVAFSFALNFVGEINFNKSRCLYVELKIRPSQGFGVAQTKNIKIMAIEKLQF